MPLPEDFQRKMRDLRVMYLKDLPGKLDELETAFVTAGNKFDELLTAQRMAHSLAGSGATFGVIPVSSISRKIELQILDHRERAEPLPDELRGEILLAIEEMRSLASDSSAEEKGSAPKSTLPKADGPPKKLIAVVEDDKLLAGDLRTQLGYFGYEVQHFGTSAELAKQGLPKACEAILCDISFSQADHSALIKNLGGMGDGTAPPILFMSTRNDMEARLTAVRAGGRGYFTKPVDMTALVTHLDQLTGSNKARQVRVLVVDDSLNLAKFYAQVIDQGGMVSRILTDPLLINEALSDFQPDLILLDMYMPLCSGVELTQVIRQQDAYVGLPIVYLSGEIDIATQLAAMDAGADDFLQKPIEPQHLLASIRARTARHGQLRSYIVKDGLTNLLNHSRLREALDVELNRAVRAGQSVSFAMIDLDHFKSVNDQYGHPAGDQVLRALSRLLIQRLRKTDIAGRYGGEEFGVVLPDTDLTTAHRVIDVLREDFAQVRHMSGDREFKVTFSAGIAEFPAIRGVDGIGRAADVALYEAKRKGRNRVEVSLPPRR